MPLGIGFLSLVSMLPLLGSCLSWNGRVCARRGRLPRIPRDAYYYGCSSSLRPPRILSPRNRFYASAAVVDQEELYGELKRLSMEIRQHDEIYYSAGTEPELSDSEYDALVAREAALCRDHPHLLERIELESGLGKQTTRYRGRVGSLLPSMDRFRKRPHLDKMYSLNNAHTTEEVLAWLTRIRRLLRKGLSDEDSLQIEVLTEPKLDGLSLSLRYSRPDGDPVGSSRRTLEWAATRGDGRQGQDVSIAVQQGLAVPLELAWPWDAEANAIEVRGEVVLPQSVFASLSEKNITFSNARNAASGILLRSKQAADDSEIRMLRQHLRFYAYGVAASAALPDGVQLRDALKEMGFLTPEPMTTTLLTLYNETDWDESDIQPMLNYHKALEEHRSSDSEALKKSTLSFEDYDMDGCVHKVTDQSLRSILGNTPRAPRWAIAHKFAAESIVTRLLAVDLQVGRTGALTPVAILEPVELNGVSIQRATLHNFGHMQQILGSDRIPVGSQVLVRRAGEVIPQILRRVDSGIDESGETDMISLEVPEACPACGSPVATEEVNRTGMQIESAGQVLRCTGPPLLCQPRAVSALAHAFSRDALDVSGVSQARLEKLMSLEYLRTPADLFGLAMDDTKLEELSEVDGWGKKSVQNLADKAKSVASKGVTLARFIYCLGIRFVGINSSDLVATVYRDVEDFLGAVEAVKDLEDPDSDSFALLREDEEATKGIGPVLLSSLVEFAKEPELVRSARALASCIVVHTDDSRKPGTGSSGLQGSIDSPIAGFKIVFTGSIAGLTRSEAKKVAKSMGAKSISSSVSKSTDLVVAGAKGGKKLLEAETLGVRVISGEDFIEMMETFKAGEP
jgi:DNA ligase (NAD+)